MKFEDLENAVLVCLINCCAMWDITPTHCLRLAWEEIRHRKGRMIPGGVFVKEEVQA